MSLLVEKTRRKSFRGDVDVVSDVVNSKKKKRHSFRGDVDLEKIQSKEKRRTSFRSSYVDREDDSLDALMNEKAKIKKAHSERLEKKKKKRGGSLNIKRSSSFFDRFRRSRSHEAPKTPFTVMYDCEKDEENLSKFRQRRHSRNIENCAEKLLLSSVTLTLDDNTSSASHLAMEVKRMKFEETERTIMELERKKKEEMKKMRRRSKKKKRRKKESSSKPS